MKVLLMILGIVVVAAIAVVVGCRIMASRSTEATVALTAKIPGKIAVVYYSQSKVGNTAAGARAATSWTCARHVLPRWSRKGSRFAARTRSSAAWARA